MRTIFKWGIVGVLALGVLGALFGEDPPSTQAGGSPDTAAAAVATASANPEPTPTPKPAVRLRVTDRTVYSDAVTIVGRVTPRRAKVSVDGERVSVGRNGRFSLPVNVRRGENDFEVSARAKGFRAADVVTTLSRELSSAERAQIRAARAAARANRRAVEAAEDYLSYTGFSKQGLYEQLSSSAGSGFTASEAQYAVDHVDVNWNREAVESARSYLDVMPMSRDALIDQLTSSAGAGFTYEQAMYAVERVY